MALGLRFDVRQSQGLVLTPQLQQAIKLLQLSNIELSNVVDRELSENPFLARHESAPEQRATPPEREPNLDGMATLKPGRDGADDGWSQPATASASDSRLRLSRNGGRGFEEGEPAFDARLSKAKTLADHVREQISGFPAPETSRKIAHLLVDYLDEDGYLRDADRDIADQLQLKEEGIKAARLIIQGCDPPGIGAIDLADCLAIQLRDRNRFDPAMATLVNNLPLVARADFTALQRLCQVDAEDVRDMILELKLLDPRPGSSFAPRAEPIDAIPDIVVMQGRLGQWRIELNESTLPRVLVDRRYYADLSNVTTSRRDREFMSERYQAATWLAKALDQRAKTLLKVASAIFERQSAFLESGAHHLRPLVLRDIAEATGLHESTVSRATADKFASTPRGTFPLRYFFTTAIAGTSGAEMHSAEAIRQRIKRMIEAEDPINVLSDDQIVESLKQVGVAIARRTVAKYRESLGIASSVQRRRSKALQA
ncbi:RNA polymerase, sigma 54 subunit, RpoN/SigL [Arboricoccus pini]|uniref:RNA polymerase sigma-54 factor n=1 Tax=Arboricoccus pini TaxID=1963835 RepID=A0A212QZN2_9PROT|nr:RNA polymerase factor sigma-54 [Arboricoccus pini]SNB65208.1 RNA polymerase, sigma 54 subunit, RpoN/SigL [Arboricoccus pini]